MRRKPGVQRRFGEVAGAAREDAAVAADQHRIRQHVVVVAEERPRGRRPFPDRRSGSDSAPGVRRGNRASRPRLSAGDADDLQALCREALLGLIEQRHLLAAGSAPACPEVDQHELCRATRRASAACLRDRAAAPAAPRRRSSAHADSQRRRRHRAQPAAGEETADRSGDRDEEDQRIRAVEHRQPRSLPMRARKSSAFSNPISRSARRSSPSLKKIVAGGPNNVKRFSSA